MLELVYPQPSGFVEGDSSELHLTSSNFDVPLFFRGHFTEPRRSVDRLLALAQVVGSRFYTPPSMVAKLIRESDPIVTCTQDVIRWEGFSACCSVYCRVDMGRTALSGGLVAPGTTNVDFGPHMIEALAKARVAKSCALSIGRDFIEVKHEQSEATEKRVAVPRRWLQALVEAQHHQQSMTLQMEIGAVEFRRFLQSLPNARSRRQAFVVRAGRGLRLAYRETKGAIALDGWERLRVLERLLAQVERVSLYKNQAQATCWQLSCGDAEFYLVLSPKTWRGFSGEGQALFELSEERSEELESRLIEALGWNGARTSADLTELVGLDITEVASSLSCMSATGQVGFDLQRQGYFRRELPFPWEDFEKFHPRLKAARNLLGNVRFQGGTAWIQSAGVEYRVAWQDEKATCTCPWYINHGLERGPCKHILAAQWSLRN